MKYVSYITFCVILLCSPALRGQSALTLSAEDVKFLSSCGVLQDDINVIPKLPSDGLDIISLKLSSKSRKCSSFKHFMDTRDYLRKFTPPPSVCPSPPDGYDPAYYLTPTEAEYISKVLKEILDRNLRNPR